jgi:hypothetical protein
MRLAFFLLQWVKIIKYRSEYLPVRHQKRCSNVGGGGGGLETAIKYSDGASDTPFSYVDAYAQVNENLLLDTTNAGVNTSIIVSVTPNIEINSGVAVTVGAGKTMVIDVLQIGDLWCHV